MLDAILNGKLSREQENMEDILTSIVFGMIKYLPPQDALFPFLSKSELPTGEKPLNVLSSVNDAKVEYLFWHKLKGRDMSCEPDVLITISSSNDHRYIVLIEAKYHSGKSSFSDESESPNDQLAREWVNLKILAQKMEASPYLIYLTSDFGIPFEQIKESQEDLQNNNEEEGVICWLSWRHFPLLDEIEKHEMLKDLSKLLRERMKLIFYEGISISNSINPIGWRYEQLFNWSIIPVKPKWKFTDISI